MDEDRDINLTESGDALDEDLEETELDDKELGEEADEEEAM